MYINYNLTPHMSNTADVVKIRGVKLSKKTSAKPSVIQPLQKQQPAHSRFQQSSNTAKFQDTVSRGLVEKVRR